LIEIFAEKLPEELQSTPHIIYSWNTNYNEQYLLSSANPKNTYARIKLENISKEVIRNLQLDFFYLPDVVDSLSVFLNTYELTNEYIQTKHYFNQAFEPLDTVSFDLLSMTKGADLFRNDSIFYKDFIFPKPYSFHSIQMKKNDSIPITDLLNSPENLQKVKESAFFNRIGKLETKSYLGAPYRIIVEYEIKNIHIKQILYGGIFYAIEKVEGNYYTLPIVSGSIVLSAYSFWNKINSIKIRPFKTYQNILNEHVFGENVSHFMINVLDSKKEISGVIFPVSIPKYFNNCSLNWTHIENANYYLCEVYLDSSLNKKFSEIEVIDTFCYPSNLTPNTQYFFRIKALNSRYPKITSNWSNLISVVTK
jgi:hypothetical protein